MLSFPSSCLVYFVPLCSFSSILLSFLRWLSPPLLTGGRTLETFLLRVLWRARVCLFLLCGGRASLLIPVLGAHLLRLQNFWASVSVLLINQRLNSASSFLGEREREQEQERAALRTTTYCGQEDLTGI